MLILLFLFFCFCLGFTIYTRDFSMVPLPFLIGSFLVFYILIASAVTAPPQTEYALVKTQPTYTIDVILSKEEKEKALFANSLQASIAYQQRTYKTTKPITNFWIYPLTTSSPEETVWVVVPAEENK